MTRTRFEFGAFSVFFSFPDFAFNGSVSASLTDKISPCGEKIPAWNYARGVCETPLQFLLKA